MATFFVNDGRDQRRWWKEAAVYQIWPRSFKDSNGDGIGDIPGITSKLDYLKHLGVDVVWLSPVYKSPQADMGYDISDYKAIDPQYGTMEDMHALIAGLHQRNMKLMMDLVVNHTSDQHAWFEDSRSSKAAEKRDWYIWRKPRHDAAGNPVPPNNWEAVFGGSAWTYCEDTHEYYLHLFTEQQPDLNWEHEPVREAVWDLMRFWLDKKVDGFRMDVINLISKPPGLPDAPVTFPDRPWQPADQVFANGPRLHEFLRAMRREVLDKYDTITVGEMPYCKDPKEVLKAVGAKRHELDMIFQFEMVDIDFGPEARFSPRHWDLPELKGIVNSWQTFMIAHDGWNSLYLENHDQARTVSRFVDRAATDASSDVRRRAACMLATFLGCQSGTLYVYQGQELGMKNMPRDWGIKEYKDVETQARYYKKLADCGGDEEEMRRFMHEVQQKARDHGRTPVQWDASPHAGFTTGTPWMRVNDDYAEWNAASQTHARKSVFTYWQALLALRRTRRDVFVYGTFEMLSPEHAKVCVYRRAYEPAGTALVVLNFSPEPTKWTPHPARRDLQRILHSKRCCLKNYEDVKCKDGGIELRGFEAAVFFEDHQKP